MERLGRGAKDLGLLALEMFERTVEVVDVVQPVLAAPQQTLDPRRERHRWSGQTAPQCVTLAEYSALPPGKLARS